MSHDSTVSKGEVKELVVASNNQHKLLEIRAMLGPSWSVKGASEVAPNVGWDETGTTFLENARIKIAALRPYTKGCILADDSGLCVDELGGLPGVNSSSFGGVEGDHTRNIEHLLSVLRDVPNDRRGAHFYCLILFQDEASKESQFEGRCFGRIATVRRGVGGFGYDPIFMVGTSDTAMAEMSESEKNAISHRGQAMKAFGLRED